MLKLKKITKQKLLYQNKSLIGPQEVHIDITNNCNNACIGCWCHSPLLDELKMPPSVRKKTLSYDVLKNLVDELALLGTKKIKLIGGGDPSVHPQFMEIVRYIRNRGIDCWINTNFLLIDKYKAKKLIDWDVGLIDLSICLFNTKILYFFLC